MTPLQALSSGQRLPPWPNASLKHIFLPCVHVVSPAKLGQSSLTKSRTSFPRNPAPTSRVLAFHMRNPHRLFMNLFPIVSIADPDPRSSTHLGTCPIPSSSQKPSWLPQLQEPGPLRRGIFTPLMLEGFSSGLRAELQGPGPQVLTPNAPRAEREGLEHEGIPGLGARKHPRRRELAWTTSSRWGSLPALATSAHPAGYLCAGLIPR